MNRREFFKLMGAGALGLVLAPLVKMLLVKMLPEDKPLPEVDNVTDEYLPMSAFSITQLIKQETYPSNYIHCSDTTGECWASSFSECISKCGIWVEAGADEGYQRCITFPDWHQPRLMPAR